MPWVGSLGSGPHQWCSREDNRDRRDVIRTELDFIEEGKKVATAGAGQAKECVRINWEVAKEILL